MFSLSSIKIQKLSKFPSACIYKKYIIYNIQKILRISLEMYIYFEPPKIKLLQDRKVTMITLQNKTFFHLCFSSFLFGFVYFIFFFSENNVLFNTIPGICPNWQSNFNMGNKNKKCDSEFWSDVYAKILPKK